MSSRIPTLVAETLPTFRGIKLERAPQVSSSLNPFLGPRKLNPDVRVRRSFFYVPASEEKKVTKAMGLNMDCVCLDIEDGVALNRKEAAREAIIEVLKKEKKDEKQQFGSAEKAIRINAIGSGLEIYDLNAIDHYVDCFDTLVVPKVESAEQLTYISQYLDTREAAKGIYHQRIKILAQIESARGLVSLREICVNQPRLDGLIFSSEDLCADMGMTRTPEAKELLYPRSRMVTYATAFGLQPIDMVCINFRDLSFLQKETEEGARMGFSGKQVIHPAQIDIVNQGFLPPKKTVDFARKILATNEQGQVEGKGAFDVDGVMIDMPMVKWAERVVQIVDAAAKQDKQTSASTPNKSA